MLKTNQKFLLFIISFLPIIKSQKEELKFVFQMHRHGARAPFTGVKNERDCFNESWINDGEISEVGKRMHYLLGVRNRKRFMTNFTFLNKNYDPHEILIYSTNVNRTIQSIYSQLQGLFPFGTGRNIPETLHDINILKPKHSNYSQIFQNVEEKYFKDEKKLYAMPYKMNIVPIHLFYIPDHQVQLHDHKNCPGLKENYLKQLTGEKVKEFRKKLETEFKDVLKDIENTTNSSFLDDYWVIYKYMDTFIVDETDGKEMKILKDKLNNNITKWEIYSNLSKEFLFMDYYNINFYDVMISQISMTNTMRVIIKYMDDIVQNKKDKSKVKYLIYSMHDTTFGAMEVFNNLAFNTSIEYANFAENGFYELYKINNTFKVRLIIKDKIRDDMNYTVFKEKVEKKLYSDEQIKEKCKWQIDNKKNNSNILKITIICLIAFNMVLILLIVCNLFYKKAQKQDIML